MTSGTETTQFANRKPSKAKNAVTSIRAGDARTKEPACRPAASLESSADQAGRGAVGSIALVGSGAASG